mgnify:CR=1 FL=1
MTLRLLHTADWQLGKPFANIPGDAGALLREARFAVVRRIAELAVARQVDAVLVAGDVFDANEVSEATLHKALQAMASFAGPWVLLPGNHDAHLAECVWTRLKRLGLPANCIVAAQPTPIPLADGRLVILPAPLTARRTYDDPTLWMDAADTPAAALRVGLAHGSLRGRLPDAADSDNPLDPARADLARLDYLALGDWHGTLEVAPRTWYAGTPEPDRFPQNDPGNVLIVELAGPGLPPRVERMPVASYRWSTVTLRLTPEDDPAERVERLLQGVAEPARALVRLIVDGEVGLAGHTALETALRRWAALLCHLRCEDAGLQAAPLPRDLAHLDKAGIIGVAARRLSARAATGSKDERADAALALRQLWSVLARVPSA